jgi:hypothetical protein
VSPAPAATPTAPAAPADITPVDEPVGEPGTGTTPPATPTGEQQPVAPQSIPIVDPVTHEVIGTCRDGACGLNVRSAPSLDSNVVGAVLEGSTLQIECQARGDTVSNGHARSNVWNRLSDGTWVSDFYVDTPRVGEFSNGIPRC